MIGWFFNPHGPETKAVKRVYLELASLLNSVGTEQFNLAKERTLLALKDADTTLLAGYISWHSSNMFKRLYLLKEMGNLIWSDILEIAAEGRTKLPPKLGETILEIADSLDNTKGREVREIPLEEGWDKTDDQVYFKICEAAAIMNEPISKINHEIIIIKPTLKRVFLDAFDKNSIVFLSSLKYGIVLMTAAMIAFAFEFDRSYWIPVSCGAVMLGSTIISTFHRAIQRSIGTTIGILVATLILSSGPSPITVALLIALLGFLTEIFMVQNYAFAVTFITPNALLIAESTTQVHSLSYFATARIVDILIGCVIGLIGVLLVGRQTASSRLPHIMAKTIRSQSQLLHMLFCEKTSEVVFKESREQNKMRTNMVNLKTVYSTALGEIQNNNKELEYFSPAIFSIEHLGYLLDLSAKIPNRPVLPDNNLAQFLLVFETMAKTVEQNQPATKKTIPEIEGYSKIQKEIVSLQNALNRLQNYT